MGVKLSLVIKPFSELLPALEAGEVDMVISGMTITPERNMKVAFAGPYHISGKALLTKFKSLVTSEDTSKLNSEAFAYTALESSTSATLVETMMPKARLVTAPDYDAAVGMVLTNKVDALVADYHVCVLSLLQASQRRAGLADHPVYLRTAGHRHAGGRCPDDELGQQLSSIP
jgi:polar amino acid transport system substrate-binding protein